MRVRLCITLIACVLLNACVADLVQAAGKRPFAIFSPEEVHLITKDRAPKEAELIIKEAEAFLSHPIQARSKVHFEGMVDPGDMFVARDWDKMLALAIAYRLTDDVRYIKRLKVYFREWLGAFNLSRSPILPTQECLEKHPVFMPGEQCLDPIDDSRLSSLILAYDLAQDALPKSMRMQMIQFMHNVAQSYLLDMALRKASVDPKIREGQRSNWQAHRVKLAVLSAYVSGDRQFIKQALSNFKRFIQDNMVYPARVKGEDGKEKKVIVNDGSVFDFYKRDAIHYVVYDLEPLLMAASAAKAHGEDLYGHVSPKNASLRRALEWLVPYATGVKKHEEFVGSKVGIDNERRKAGWQGYFGRWDAKTAKTLFRMTVKLDKSFDRPEIRNLITGPYSRILYDSKMEIRTEDPGQALVGFLFALDADLKQ